MKRFYCVVLFIYAIFPNNGFSQTLSDPAECEAMSPDIFLDPSIEPSKVEDLYLAMTYHRGKNDGDGQTNGCFIYRLSNISKDEANLSLESCVLAKDLEAPLGIPAGTSGRWIQDCNFADDNRSERQRQKLGEADHGDLRLLVKFRTSPGNNLTRQNTILEVDLGMTEVLRNTPFVVDPVFADGTIMGQHDMGLVPGEEDKIYGNPWEPRFNIGGRGKTGVTVLSGGIQVFDHNTGIVDWSLSGWGIGDCDSAGTCRHSEDQPLNYMFDRQLNRVQDGGLTTGEHNNSAVVVYPEEHFDDAYPQCRVIDSERWYGIIRCQVVDEAAEAFTTGWVLHGTHVTEAVKKDWPVIIEGDPLGGPSDHHNANIEYLKKNRIMLLDNGNFHHADPCAPPVTQADIAGNPELSGECVLPLEERRGCAFSRALEYEYEGKVDGADKFSLKFSWPPEKDYPAMLPDDNQQVNDLLSDADKAGYCQPFWDRNYETKGIVYSSFISGAKRLWNGQTLIASHDIRSRNFVSSTEPTQSIVIVDKKSEPVARILVNSNGENTFAHYRVDAVSAEDFEAELSNP